MKRRNFLQAMSATMGAPLILQGLQLKAMPTGRMLTELLNYSEETDRVLVIIQLSGGNDGLNTIIPLDQYPALSKVRQNVLINESKVLPLKDAVGLHPALAEIKNLYSENKVGVLQNVGYPDPNYSHFRSMDIYTSASDANVIEHSGWGGRYLNESFPGFPDNYPNQAMPDPLGITIGPFVSTILQGPAVSMGMAIQNAENFYNIVSGGVDDAPDTNSGRELTFIRRVIAQTQVYTEAIKAAAAKANNKSTKYPTAGENRLADQLKVVARLIAGGLKTRLYVVELGGFDTHANQVDVLNTEQGEHARLLGFLSKAIDAFQDDLKLLNLEDRVVGMTFSEFGRRIISNSSRGTDHGAAAPMLVFGTQVNPIIHGTNPIIPEDAGPMDNLPMQFDFRSIYYSILMDWFGVAKETLDRLMFKEFAHVPVIKPRPNSIDESLDSNSFEIKAFPNPARDIVTIAFEGSGFYRLQLFDSMGKRIRVIFERNLSHGVHQIPISIDDLANGNYFIQLQHEGKAMMVRVVKN